MMTRIFCDVDDFCQTFEPDFNLFLIEACGRKRIKSESLALSEIMTIVIMFHRSGYRCLKHFYINNVLKHWNKYFNKLVSYNRFVELIPKALLALCAFLKCRYGKPTGISYIDATGLAVCTKTRSKKT